jgi:hypothetical protein
MKTTKTKTTTPDIAAENTAAADAFDGAQRFTASDVGRVSVSPEPFFLFRLPWTMLMIAVGLSTLAACVLLPLREENRRLAHAFAGIEAEAEFVRKQVDANEQFLSRVHEDPALVDRLVMRATRRPVAGQQFLDPQPVGSFNASPYAITQITPPPPQTPYVSDLHPALASLVTNVRSRVILIAAGLFLIGGAVIIGSKDAAPAADANA